MLKELSEQENELIEFLRDPKLSNADLAVERRGGDEYTVRSEIYKAAGDYEQLAGLGKAVGVGRSFDEAWTDCCLEALRSDPLAPTRVAAPLSPGLRLIPTSGDNVIPLKGGR